MKSGWTSALFPASITTVRGDLASQSNASAASVTGAWSRTRARPILGDRDPHVLGGDLLEMPAREERGVAAMGADLVVEIAGEFDRVAPLDPELLVAGRCARDEQPDGPSLVVSNQHGSPPSGSGLRSDHSVSDLSAELAVQRRDDARIPEPPPRRPAQSPFDGPSRADALEPISVPHAEHRPPSARRAPDRRAASSRLRRAESGSRIATRTPTIGSRAAPGSLRPPSGRAPALTPPRAPSRRPARRTGGAPTRRASRRRAGPRRWTRGLRGSARGLRRRG